IRRASGHDYTGFAEHELRQRKELLYPPWSSMARVILRGENYDHVHESARELTRRAREGVSALEPGIRILGPAPAPVARLRGQHRFHFQIFAADVEAILGLWRESLRDFEAHEGVDFTIDIDPLDMR